MLTPVDSTGALQAALRCVEVATLAGAGHMIMSEAPDALHDALQRAL